MSRAEREAAENEAALARGMAAGKAHAESLSEPFRRQQAAAAALQALEDRKRQEIRSAQEAAFDNGPIGKGR